jgi:hypothetical protein
MPTFIPDKLKTPGDFPSVDANDNQIRGFGFFADNDARTELAEEFRCHGYLAFMKDSDQFKQYNSADLLDAAWRADANWDLLEGTTTDTYWSADIDGVGIYYSGQVVVGASTYDGDEKLYVNGTAKVTTSLETPVIKTSSGLDIIINTDETDTAGDDFVVKYGVVGSGGDERTALDISPYTTTPNIAFGNIFDDFKLDYFSSSFSEFRTLSANSSETGFKFTDAYGGDGSFLIRMKNDASYFEMKDGGRDLTVTPHFYKIKSTVEVSADVTHAVEMLMPDSATGDWTFNHLGNKDFVFNTNTSSPSTKLITKFHAAGNGVVSIGTANYYNEYNGIQYPTYSASLQPRLFIVNDGTSNVGVRVQSGDITLGTEGNRTQGRYWTDMRDDGFYISRNSTGPAYDDSDDVVEGEEWAPSAAGQPSAAIGMKRNGVGNSLQLFARNDLFFTSGSNDEAFSVIGDPNADVRDLVVASPLVDNRFRVKVYNDATNNGNIVFNSENIGNFLVASGNENRVTSGSQILSSLVRGADFRVTSFGDPASNLTPSLAVYSLSGKSGNTGYWWGLDSFGYDTEQEMLDAGTTIDTNKSADQLAIYVPKHGSGKVGIGTTNPTAKLYIEGDAKVNGTFYTLNGLQNLGNRADMSLLNAANNTGYLRFITQKDGSQNESMRIVNSGYVGIGTTSPLAKLHVMGAGASIAVGDVAGYDGGLTDAHSPGEAPGLLFLNGGGLITRGGTNIINSDEVYTNSNSYNIEWKPGKVETYRQAVLGTANSSGIAFRTDNQKTFFSFGKYGFSITDNLDAVGSTVDKPLYIKPRFPNDGTEQGYTGGGNDGSGNINQSLVYPLYFHYADAPSTLEHLTIRTQVNDAKGASYDYGLDYDADATQGDTGNPFTANKNRLKISATFPFAHSQQVDGLHTQLSGVIGTSEASFEIRNAYETDVSGGTFANTDGTINTALYVGGQRFFEPRSRNSTWLYGFGGISFTRASNYGTTGDLSPEDNDLVNNITTDVTGGTAGSYVLSTSSSGEITLGSSTYDTSVDGELALKVTLSAADNISAVEILYGGGKSTASTGFRSGDTITIPATKLGSSSTQAVITLSNNSFVTDGGVVSMSFTHRHSIGIGVGNTSIVSNDTNTNYSNLGAGGNFHLARTAKYTAYRDHWFKFIEGGESGHWAVIQGGFLKGAKAMVGYSNDNQVAYDGTAIGTGNYGSAALRIVASPSGMRVGEVAVAPNSSSTLKFAEADLAAAGFTDESSTWGVDYDTDGGWYVGMPIYISEAGTNHMISKVRPDGVFQYNSGSDTSTFQRRTVLRIDNSTREMLLDSNLTTSGGDVLVYPRTESDLIRCRNLMGRDMFVVKSNGRLDVESGLIKMRAAAYNAQLHHEASGYDLTMGDDECIIYYDGTNLKVIKGSGTLSPVTIA